MTRSRRRFPAKSLENTPHRQSGISELPVRETRLFPGGNALTNTRFSLCTAATDELPSLGTTRRVAFQEIDTAPYQPVAQ
jgi:hypothetical protein